MFSARKFNQTVILYFITVILGLLFSALTSCVQAQAQTTIKSFTGKTIPVKVVSGADVTIAPIDHEAKGDHVGWLQVNTTVYPVYQGPRGGLFTYRPNKQGIKTNYYLTDEQKLKYTKE
jgi:hypothetical protein